MSHAAPIRALVLAVTLAGWSAAPAHAGTIVFDFEDGLQGWELGGSAQRVQTQLLGGEWAIFGDGVLVGSITLRTDPIPLRSVTVEMFFLDGESNALELKTAGTLFARSDPFDLILSGNPSLLSVEFDVDAVVAQEVTIRWRRFSPSNTGAEIVAFIDNITFHTIPEPSVLGMLVVSGIAALFGGRRRPR